MVNYKRMHTMKNSKIFKELKTIQKLGAALIIISTIITIGTLLNIINDENKIPENGRNIMLILGFTFYLVPNFKNGIRKNNSKILTSLMFLFVSLFSVQAQDYSEQIEAFKQSFTEKNTEKINPYLSSELKFDPIPVANTSAIMDNIVSQLPKLNDLIILESEKGKAKVKYDFDGLGISESHIYFDHSGKMTRIEMIENLIKQEMAAQQKMKESVQMPTFGKLAKKYVPTKVEFKSKDGLFVNGNLYEIDKNKPVILLCHQAGYNRIEYADIAPKLNDLGYNCLAIDQRSGGNFAGKPNNTFERATEQGKPTNYVDAQQDIEAAINFLSERYNQKVTVWGSSYSSSLALFESLKNNKVNASISFSPGDYFGNERESLADVFKRIGKPFFITSSKEESTVLKSLVGDTKLKNSQIQFIPTSDGFHGSRALWTGQKGAEEYWTAVMEFLNSF